MKKRVYLFFVFFTLQSFSQNWSFYKDFPKNIAPADIEINNQGTMYMLTTDGRIFYKPINQNWILMTDPSGFGPINPLDITINKSSNTLIVSEGLGGGIKRTSTVGNSWQSNFIFTNPISGLHESVYELSNVSANNTFYSQIILGDFINRLGKFTNNGQNIEFIQYDPTNNSNKSITELHVTTNNTLIIGTWNSGIIISNDGGQSFQQTNLNQHQIYKIAEDNSGRVYALGYNITNDEIFLVQSTDYVNWNMMNLPNNSERFTCLFYDSFSQLLWLGSETALHKLPINSSSSGSWSNASFNNSNQYHVAVIGDSFGNLYNFSFQGSVQKLNTSGNLWLDANNGITGTSNFITFGANNKLFSANYSNNTISSLENLNANWSSYYLGGNNTGVNNIFSTSTGKIYVNLGSSLMKSTNNGLTYNDITPQNLNNFVSKFYVGENNSLFLVKSNEPNNLYISNNDGFTWTLINTFSDPIDDIAQDSNGVIFITVSNFDIFAGNYNIHFSMNNGINWGVLNNTIPVEAGTVSNVSVFSKLQNTYVSFASLIYLFNYQSNSLTPINSPNSTPFFEGALYIDDANNFYVFADFLYKSTNGGQSWYSLSRPSTMVPPYYVDSIVFDSNQIPYIVTNNTFNESQHGIYKVIDLLNDNNISLPIAINVFPNPTTEVLNIQNTEDLKNFAIYDVKGRKIDVFNEAVQHINVSSYQNGIYFLNGTTKNGNSFSIKFIKQ